MIKYPKIPPFRKVKKELVRCLTLSNEIRLLGTPKLHGTNAAISFHNGTITYQSRNRELVVGDDNHGFAAYMSQFESSDKYGVGLKTLLSLLNTKGYSLKTATNPTTFFGEWCGLGIAKGTAVNRLDKKLFVIFGILNGENWIPLDHWAHIEIPELNIYNVASVSKALSFNSNDSIELIEQEIDKILDEIENHCPFAARFGIDGGAEGMVFIPVIDDAAFDTLKFKVKTRSVEGESPKKIKEVNQDKANAIKGFTAYAVSTRRLEQAIDYLKEMGKPLEIESMGTFLQWISNDILEEESDGIETLGLTKKEVTKGINERARKWFMDEVY